MVFSNDAFLVRGSSWGAAFLLQWWKQRASCPNAHADQGAMWMAIIDMLPSPDPSSASVAPAPVNSTQCSRLCPAKAEREALYACVDAHFRRLRGPAGPVLFTPVDFDKGTAGLCLNGYQNDHTRYTALQHRMPFCLHSKHPAKWASPALRKKVRWDVFKCPRG